MANTSVTSDILAKRIVNITKMASRQLQAMIDKERKKQQQPKTSSRQTILRAR